MKDLKDLGLFALDMKEVNSVNGGINIEKNIFIVCCIDIGVYPIKF